MSVRLHLASAANVAVAVIPNVQIAANSRSVAVGLNQNLVAGSKPAENIYTITQGVVSLTSPVVVDTPTGTIIDITNTSNLGRSVTISSDEVDTLYAYFATGTTVDATQPFTYVGPTLGTVALDSGFLDDRWTVFSYTSTAPSGSTAGTTTVQILGVTGALGPTGSITGAVQQIGLASVSDGKKHCSSSSFPSNGYVVATVAADTEADDTLGLTGPYSLNVYRFRSNGTFTLVDSKPLPQLPLSLDILSSECGRPALIAVGTRLASESATVATVQDATLAVSGVRYTAELQVFNFDGCKLRLTAARKRNADVTAVELAPSGQYLISGEGLDGYGAVYLYKIDAPYLQLLDVRAVASQVLDLSWDACQNYLAALIDATNNLLIFQTA